MGASRSFLSRGLLVALSGGSCLSPCSTKQVCGHKNQPSSPPPFILLDASYDGKTSGASYRASQIGGRWMQAEGMERKRESRVRDHRGMRRKAHPSAAVRATTSTLRCYDRWSAPGAQLWGDGGRTSVTAGTHCHFHPVRLQAHPLPALSEGRRREGGIRNHLRYWQGKQESANLPGQHPGGGKT